MIPGTRLRPALWGWALISALLAGGMLLVQAFGSTSSSRTYVMFLVNVMLVVSLQTFIGNSGIVSFGHVAFMGIGAYTTALVTILSSVKVAQLPELPSFLANANFGLPAAVVVSALAAFVVAAIFGGAIIRMTEATMAMATLALLVVVHTFFQNATTYTRGALGLAGIPVRTTLGVATVAAIGFVLLSRLYKESGPGLRLRATREDPLSAASVGTNVVRARYGVWLLSAAMMGAAGLAVGPERDRLQREPVLLRDHLRAAGDAGDRRPDVGDRRGRGRGDHHVPHRHARPGGAGGRDRAVGAAQDHRHGAVRDRVAHHHHADPATRRHLRSLGDRRPGAPVPPVGQTRAPRRGDGHAEAQEDAGAMVEPIDAAAPPVLDGQQVAKHFEGVVALAGVDIEVRTGEILGLIGPNGSGKTTLLNVISGVYVPTEGHVIFDGQEIGGRKPHQVAALGLSRTFQNIRLFAQLTVRENVEAATPPGTAESAVDEMLAWFGLTGVQREKAVNLPYGMQRRLEIARAVVRRPSLILLDEPAAGMNEDESDELLENIRRIRSTLGCSVVIVDHDLRLIMKLCDRIQVLDQGRTIAMGAPRQIAEDPAVIAAYLGGPSTKSA